MKKQICIVDDEPKIGELFVTVLRRDGFDSRAFTNPAALLEHIDSGQVPDVILADLMMPGMNGIEMLESLKKRNLSIPVIIMTAHSSVQTAVEAMRLGAFHYLQKPVNLEEMRALLDKALDLYDAKKELTEIKNTKRATHSIDKILGKSDAIERVRETIRTLQNVPNTIVLISGETGTGKNLVAKTVHYNSSYNAGRFMEINCAALPDNLLEAELFGYEQGAFTDARDAKPGLLEVADGGTVFLDEIDSMSPSLQAKLLSFLESRTFRRLGGVEDMRVTTRILCATNANLQERVAAKEFRKDLYFRINVVNIYMPALREMGEDVVNIAAAIVNEFNRELNRSIEGFAPGAERKLLEHDWPGNVRELRNVLERAMIFTQSNRIDAHNLAISSVQEIQAPVIDDGKFRFELGESLEDLEKAYILQTLQTMDASYAEISDRLGISKKTLWEKRKRYNLDDMLDR
ncbi:MAG TPA: sigma-54 dependent transcriptional regulator [Rhodothermales bacterium]|nr:sigma-54 dependent transcriptional regulator [Rhodothermales bacterium]